MGKSKSKILQEAQDNYYRDWKQRHQAKFRPLKKFFLIGNFLISITFFRNKLRPVYKL